MRRKLFFKQYFKLKKKVKCISIWVIVLHQRPAFSSRPFQPLHLMNWFSNLLMLTHHLTVKPWLFFFLIFLNYSGTSDFLRKKKLNSDLFIFAVHFVCKEMISQRSFSWTLYEDLQSGFLWIFSAHISTQWPLSVEMTASYEDMMCFTESIFGVIAFTLKTAISL